MAFAKLNKLPGIVIFVDFKKAFDSIEWDYLAKVQNVFNLKEDFKRWVRILYADISSCVINDGFASPFFKLIVVYDKAAPYQVCFLSLE